MEMSVSAGVARYLEDPRTCGMTLCDLSQHVHVGTHAIFYVHCSLARAHVV